MDLRCFVAVELPEELKGEISARTEGVRGSGADAKWVKAENLHLTLKFLGNVPESALPEIQNAFEGATRPHERFVLTLRGAGVFPDMKRPRVVWIGVEDSDRLVALQRDIDAALVAIGFEAEKRAYSPHLTIGRVNSPRRRDFLLKELAALAGTEFGRAEVVEVTLMQSRLRPTGAEYSRLFGAPLRA